MNRDNDRQTSIILAVLGILPIVWLGLLIAPSVKGGLPEILPSLMNVMSDPFHIELCEDSVKAVLVLLLCYGMGIGIYFSTRRNYRRREEHGSAKWGNAKAVDKKYRQNPPSENKLMTQAVRIGLNGKKPPQSEHPCLRRFRCLPHFGRNSSGSRYIYHRRLQIPRFLPGRKSVDPDRHRAL